MLFFFICVKLFWTYVYTTVSWWKSKSEQERLCKQENDSPFACDITSSAIWCDNVGTLERNTMIVKRKKKVLIVWHIFETKMLITFSFRAVNVERRKQIAQERAKDGGEEKNRRTHPGCRKHRTKNRVALRGRPFVSSGACVAPGYLAAKHSRTQEQDVHQSS